MKDLMEYTQEEMEKALDEILFWQSTQARNEAMKMCKRWYLANRQTNYKANLWSLNKRVVEKPICETEEKVIKFMEARERILEREKFKMAINSKFKKYGTINTFLINNLDNKYIKAFVIWFCM